MRILQIRDHRRVDVNELEALVEFEEMLNNDTSQPELFHCAVRKCAISEAIEYLSNLFSKERVVTLHLWDLSDESSPVSRGISLHDLLARDGNGNLHLETL